MLTWLAREESGETTRRLFTVSFKVLLKDTFLEFVDALDDEGEEGGWVDGSAIGW